MNNLTLTEIKNFLPKYLSPKSRDNLFDELKKYPDNIDKRFYSRNVETDNLYQGDGIRDLLIIKLPDEKIEKAPSIILSNSCSISEDNGRLFDVMVNYAPILNLKKYEGMLRKDADELCDDRKNKQNKKIDQHILEIKKQRVSQIFYLPKGMGLEYEGIVILDRICSCENKSIDRNNLNKKRLFSLSNYGLYLFIFKLSVFLTRIQEGIDRR